MEIVEKLDAEINSWTLLDESEWETLLVSNSDKERKKYLSRLQDKAQEISEAKEKLKCYRLCEFIKKKYHLVSSSFVMCIEVGTIGFEAYQKGDNETAETAFSILCENGDSNGRNNYAYMIRRGEVSANAKKTIVDALKLLRYGLLNEEPYAFVNMALVFALNLGDKADWLIADELINKMPRENIDKIREWWEVIGSKGDIEGVLVHFFLLRHGKIEKSIFGNMELLSKKLSDELDNFPDWLIVLPRFSSLDDLFETMLDDDFEENLSQYLEKMPRDRKSAEEILEEMTQWDEWKLYRVLLQEYMEFLSPEEVAKTVQAYRKKFMIPLSSIIDENDLKTAGEASTED